jgi:hypothetical protein
MKNLIFTILLTFASVIAYPQQIDRIGVIKLGETEKEILSNLNINNKRIVDGATQKKKNITKILEHSVVRFKYDPTCTLVKDLVSDFYIDKYFEKCSEATIYNIPEYQIAGTVFKNFKLFFYRDTLVKIFTEDGQANLEFIRVFKAKYGEGKVTVSEYPSKDSPDKISGYTTNVWTTNSSKNIEIKLLKSYGYVKETNEYGIETGEARFVVGFRFEIQNSDTYYEMRNCSQKGQGTKPKLNDL